MNSFTPVALSLKLCGSNLLLLLLVDFTESLSELKMLRQSKHNQWIGITGWEFLCPPNFNVIFGIVTFFLTLSAMIRCFPSSHLLLAHLHHYMRPFCALLLALPAQVDAPVHFPWPFLTRRYCCGPALLLRYKRTGGGGWAWWGSEGSLCRRLGRPCKGEEGAVEEGREAWTGGGGRRIQAGGAGGWLGKGGACEGGERGVQGGEGGRWCSGSPGEL